MKIAILMNDNSYVGRQYIYELNTRQIDADIICIGTNSPVNEVENVRCGCLWLPPLFEDIRGNRNVYRFSSLRDEGLIRLLKDREYDVGIQGGTGILKSSVIQLFKYGILNFHPGDLPSYRGCSAPEWQVLEGKPIICTCHLIDEGIDTGAVYKKKKLNVSNTDYHKMRSQIYIEISKFVAEVLQNLDIGFVSKCVPQNEDKAIYRKYIGDDRIKTISEQMSQGEYS